VIEGTRRRLKKLRKKRGEIEKQQKLMAEIQHLHKVEGVPVHQLAKRFKLKPRFLYRQLAKLALPAAQLPAALPKRRKFKKVHERARDFIEDFVDKAEVPI